MGFENIAPPARSRLWKPEDVDAAADVLAEHGRVGWNEPYDSEGKARGAGSALARLLSERTGETYRVSVFARGDDAENGAGQYFSIRAKADATDESLIDPTKFKRDELIKMAADADVQIGEKDSKAKIAKAINAAAEVTAE